MNHYARYIKEREGAEYYETPEGFVSYVVSGSECFIANLYIAPEHRGLKASSRLINWLANSTQNSIQKITVLSGTIDLRAAGASHTLACALTLGFQVTSAHNNILVIAKNLEESNG